jgi:hypothetical protein
MDLQTPAEAPSTPKKSIHLLQSSHIKSCYSDFGAILALLNPDQDPHSECGFGYENVPIISNQSCPNSQLFNLLSLFTDCREEAEKRESFYEEQANFSFITSNNFNNSFSNSL